MGQPVPNSRRTLDALELRGCKIIRADRVKVGDRVCFLDDRYSYTVEEIDTTRLGWRLFRARNGTLSQSYEPDEMLYVLR